MTAKRTLVTSPASHTTVLKTDSAPVGASVRRFVTHVAEYHHRNQPVRLELVSQGVWRHQREASGGSTVWDTIGSDPNDPCQPLVRIPRLSSVKLPVSKGNAMHFDDLVNALGVIDQLTGKSKHGYLWKFVREFQTNVSGFPSTPVATNSGEMRRCSEVGWYDHALAVELREDSVATNQAAPPRTIDVDAVPNAGLEPVSGRWVTPWGLWYETRLFSLRYEFTYGPLEPSDPAQASATVGARFWVAAGPSGEAWADWPNLPLDLANALRQHLWGHETHRVYVHAERVDTRLSVKQLIIA